MPQKYVGIINITDIRRKFIPAGQTFLEADIHPYTFRKLEAQSNIVAEGTIVSIKTPGGKKVTGPASATPIAAIYPPQGDDAKLLAIENAKAELKLRNVKFAHNSGLETLLSKIDEDDRAKEAPVAPVTSPAALVAPVIETPVAPADAPAAVKEGAAKVWDFDPAELKNLPLPQIAAKYAERCKKFGKDIVPFDDSVLLIKHMSSEFGK